MNESQTIADLIARVEEAIEKEEGTSERAYSDVNTKLEELQSQLETERTRRETLEAELQLQVVGQTMSEIHSFADGLVSEGRLPPAMKDMATTLLSVAANLEGDVKSYALGDDAAAGDMTPYALVSELLRNLPQVNALRQTATLRHDTGTTAETGDIRRFSTDSSAAQAVHARVKALQDAEGLSYIQAFDRVRKELN